MKLDDTILVPLTSLSRRTDLKDYFEEGLTDAQVVGTLSSPEFTVSLAGVDSKQEQVRGCRSH